jgi:hypothetical protein
MDISAGATSLAERPQGAIVIGVADLQSTERAGLVRAIGDLVIAKVRAGQRFFGPDAHKNQRGD